MPRRRGGLPTWFSESTTPVYALDSRRVVVFFNKGCESLTSWAAADVVGKTCDYASEPDRNDPESLLSALCPPPEVWTGETVACPVTLPVRGAAPICCRGWYLPLAGAAPTDLKVIGWLSRAAAPGPAIAPRTAPEWHAELAAVRSTLRERYRIDTLIACGPAMQRVLQQVRLAADCSAAVHLSGESGTGREFLARTIHYHGPQRLQPFVPLDCAALTDFEIKRTLQRLFQTSPQEEAPLPGLQPGALFLRNVADLPRDLQASLVESLQAQDQAAAGASRVRIFSASATSLAVERDVGRLLPDLYFRLTSLMIDLPPLRERRDDLPLLAQFFIERHNRETDKQVGGVTSDVLDQFRRYNWPGNLRELAAVTAEAHAAATGPLVTAGDLPFRFRTGWDAQRVGPATPPPEISLEAFLADVERREILRVLEECGQNRARAARRLGLTRPRLYRRMEQLEIHVPGGDGDREGDSNSD